jgi:hypothetical protein
MAFLRNGGTRDGTGLILTERDGTGRDGTGHGCRAAGRDGTGRKCRAAGRDEVCET